MKKPNTGKIMKNGKSLLLAYDHGMEHGPTDFKGRSVDPTYILDIALKCVYNGFICQKGVAEKYYRGKYRAVPLVVKLNGKTNIFKGEPLSEQVCSVDEAKAIGAAAVGYTIYVGSAFESRMFEEFGRIEEQAHSLGMPVIGWMYPRGKAVKKVTPDLIAYAARVGLELGADFAKVAYTGNIASFRKVVKSAGRCRVLCLGGEPTSDKKFLELAEAAMAAGCAGMAVGRNIWQHRDPEKITRALRKVVFDGWSAEKALNYSGLKTGGS
jgi:class I fructose-bisphosphate aldolase